MYDSSNFVGLAKVVSFVFSLAAFNFTFDFSYNPGFSSFFF